MMDKEKVNKCLCFLLEKDKIQDELIEDYFQIEKPLKDISKKKKKSEKEVKRIKNFKSKRSQFTQKILPHLKDAEKKTKLIKIYGKDKYFSPNTSELRDRRTTIFHLDWNSLLDEWEKEIKAISAIERIQPKLKEFIEENREFLFNLDDFKILFYRDDKWHLPSVYGLINIALFYFCICDYLISKIDEWKLRDRLPYRKPKIKKLDKYRTQREYSILELLLKRSDDDFIRNMVALLNRSYLDSKKFDFTPEELDALHSKFISRHFHRFLEEGYDTRLNRDKILLSHKSKLSFEGQYVQSFFMHISFDMYEEDLPGKSRIFLPNYSLFEKGIIVPIKTRKMIDAVEDERKPSKYDFRYISIMLPELFDYFKPIERMMRLFE